MSEKVLLTGISGFVAKHIAIELLNSGYEVFQIDNEKPLGYFDTYSISDYLFC